jgi:hypothetical protein
LLIETASSILEEFDSRGGTGPTTISSTTNTTAEIDAEELARFSEKKLPPARGLGSAAFLFHDQSCGTW